MSFIERLQDFERRLMDAMPNIYCPVHLALGQEAVPAALSECLRPDDWLFAPHRSHGYYLAKGGDEEALYDEIMGEPSGINGGFSGSQGFSDESINFHCGAIVGGLIGVATGTALALKLNKSDAIVVCAFGDAAAEQGVLWESLNFAALLHLPIAYLCENNGMSVDAHICERQAMPIVPRVSAFGIWISGDVHDAVRSARAGVPSFYEARVTLQSDHINMSSMPIGAHL